ncbi:MAG: MaoC family dehydratase N-terminal domain-containing protein [Azonexus sp.]|nr:MaoC family dehydratase N-terminal domain-containing protein [Azonexus sp.]
MPPVPLPRRMWAGSRLRFERPLCIGAQITKTSRITDVQWKQGRSGRLAFVQVEHCIEDASGLLLVEAQDIVYREAAQAGDPLPAPQAAPAKAVWRREIYPDPVLLFRYSALTFNGHRIHYDLPYAIGVEHYPERVVHGPLIATLLLDLLRREAPQQRVMAFSFRAVRPLFQGAPFHVCGQPASDGKTAHLWAQDADGGLAMDATAELA